MKTCPDLPIGWTRTSLDIVFDVLDSQRVPVNGIERAMRLSGAQKTYPYYGATGQVGEIDGYLFEGEAVLLGEDGAPFLDAARSKAYQVDGQYWVNNHAHILRARHGMSNRYFCHQLNTIDYRPFVSGTTRLKLTQAAMKEIPFVVAPIAEQHRIASRIDELFSKIEEGERALGRVQKLVERYRQSVLKAAVTGEFTRKWREKHKAQIESGETLLRRILKVRREAWGTNRYREPAVLDVADLPDLPQGWVWASVEQLCSELSNGLSRKPGDKPPGVPILRISAVRPMRVNRSDIRYYVPERSEPLEAFQVQSGDLLFTRYNGSKELVGVSGVYRGIGPVLHPDKLIKARVVSIDHVIPEYLALSLNCGESWRHISGWVKTSAGQHGIAGSDIKRTPIPLPPFAEQREIVDVVERAAFKCDEALNACSAEFRRASALRQSTLQFAFSGKLVEQHPTDECASALLERIAAERIPSAITRTRSRRQRRTA